MALIPFTSVDTYRGHLEKVKRNPGNYGATFSSFFLPSRGDARHLNSLPLLSSFVEGIIFSRKEEILNF